MYEFMLNTILEKKKELIATGQHCSQDYKDLTDIEAHLIYTRNRKESGKGKQEDPTIDPLTEVAEAVRRVESSADVSKVLPNVPSGVPVYPNINRPNKGRI